MMRVDYYSYRDSVRTRKQHRTTGSRLPWRFLFFSFSSFAPKLASLGAQGERQKGPLELESNDAWQLATNLLLSPSPLKAQFKSQDFKRCLQSKALSKK